jgi:hypothetical protein
MSERDMGEVHLLQQSSMTTQHQIYTRNKMAEHRKTVCDYTQGTLIRTQ